MNYLALIRMKKKKKLLMKKNKISKKKKKIDNSDINENFFISMNDYRIFLDNINLVKKKIDESYKIHQWFLKKNEEEDIEFDNLKKNIVSVESELYKIDELIFENKKNGK